VLAYLLLKQVLGRRRAATPSSTSRYTFGFFNRAAVVEEQIFREGAEGWSWPQRITSCLVFGAVHLTNLIYPLATVLPLAVGGGLFMWVYLKNYRVTRSRRKAVLEASVTHRVYNRIALIMVVLVMFGLTASLVKSLLALLGVVGAIWLLMAASDFRRARAIQPMPVRLGEPAAEAGA
jgi:hypothetical protein